LAAPPRQNTSAPQLIESVRRKKFLTPGIEAIGSASALLWPYDHEDAARSAIVPVGEASVPHFYAHHAPAPTLRL
jgi:hypothetical protein